MSEQKNVILAAVLSFLVIVVWQVFLAPEPPAPREITPAEQAAIDSGQAPASIGAAAAPTMTRDAALSAAGRVPIETPRLRGSLSLRGGRVDDLDLTDYRVTLDPDSPNVTLLNPIGVANPYYAVWGWTPARGAQTGPTPAADTLWTVESGEALTPETPVTLVWENGAGLTFRRTLSIDAHYMITVEQSVENGTDQTLALAPYGIVARHGTPATINFYILHEGGVGEIDGELREIDYDDFLDAEPDPAEGGPAQRIGVAQDGWLGFTDKYWMTALAGGPGRPFTAVFKAAETAQGPVYQTDMRLPTITVGPGETGATDSMLFAGAKATRLLQDYEETRGIAGFEDAVDWGWFFFLTKPIFQLLMIIQDVVGNMGFSIIILTLIIKIVLFPLAYKSFVAMGRMKKLQPEMEKIKERAGDDKQKLQQEMLELYKKEKVNPASGCLPILVQIPIFFSLYKVIFVTLELRHAPFILWIRDLSAPDPSSWMNLFGLLPYSVDGLPAIFAFLSIGLFPILMGITMWMQQKLNPAPTDPTQAMIFAWMPFFFMFLLGQFAAGLVIYWVANNVLTFAQQYTIMRSQGVEVDFFGNVKKSFKRKRPAE